MDNHDSQISLPTNQTKPLRLRHIISKIVPFPMIMENQFPSMIFNYPIKLRDPAPVGERYFFIEDFENTILKLLKQLVGDEIYEIDKVKNSYRFKYQYLFPKRFAKLDTINYVHNLSVTPFLYSSETRSNIYGLMLIGTANSLNTDRDFITIIEITVINNSIEIISKRALFEPEIRINEFSDLVPAFIKRLLERRVDTYESNVHVSKGKLKGSIRQEGNE